MRLRSIIEEKEKLENCLLTPPSSIGSFIGFLLGSTLAASGAYFYVLQDYKTSNALLTEDIYVRLCI